MDSITIGFFLEDRAHELFLKSAALRIGEEFFNRLRLVTDIRSASHGSKAKTEYKKFIEEVSLSGMIPFDILIVAIDGNCKGFNENKRLLLADAHNQNYPRIDDIVFAIPDPHIERWYLADQRAFSSAVGQSSYSLPPRKCDRDYYKQLLCEAVISTGTKPLFGGAEFGEEIAATMDFEAVSRICPEFESFYKDLKRCFIRARDRAK